MEEHVIWREKLKRLTSDLGRGGIRVVADAINKSPTYISRMLSDPSTSQHRVVTHETCYLLTKAFPGWLDDKPTYAVINDQSAGSKKIETPKVVYEVKPKTKRQRAVDALFQTIEKINDDGLERLIGFAGALSETHPALAKQTHK